MKLYYSRTVVAMLSLMSLCWLSCIPDACGARGGQSHAEIEKKLAANPTDRQLLRSLKGTIGTIRNPTEKVRIGVIYCLGCLVTQQEREWDLISGSLRRGHARDPHVEFISSGFISDVCPSCKGGGVTLKECASCRRDPGACASCGGKGNSNQAVSTIKRKCLSCSGSGDCRVCQGMGVTRSKCLTCSGLGRSVSTKIAETVYRSMLAATPHASIKAQYKHRQAELEHKIKIATLKLTKDEEVRQTVREVAKNPIQARIRALKVLDDGILARGYSRTHTFPPQFLVSKLGARLVDGEEWSGLLYEIGKVTLHGERGEPYTFRLYSSSKEEAAQAIVDEKYGVEEKAAANNREQERASQAGGYGTGTGWFCETGYIVTCYHVIKGSRDITAVSSRYGQIPLKLVIKDEANDIAILTPIKGGIRIPVGIQIAARPSSMGEGVFTIGYPLSDLMGQTAKMTDGIVSSLAGLRDDPRTYQISVPVQSGNSGGPLINMQGEVVGIVASKLAAARVFQWTGDMPQNVNYAVKGSYIAALTSSLPPIVKQVEHTPIGNASLQELAQRTKEAVVFIIAK